MQSAAISANGPAGAWRVSREGVLIAAVSVLHERGGAVVATALEGVAARRPYRFETVAEADAFVGDLITSFAYLGCDVARD
jgi:hypothetical protein